MNLLQKLILNIKVRLGIVVPIRYLSPTAARLNWDVKGDWIDLYAFEDYTYRANERFLINLGFAMQLPKNYEANIAPRSSTFKYWTVLQTNTPGIVDNSYCGNNDIWFMSVVALADGSIKKNDRVCQMKIVKKQRKRKFVEFEKFNTKDRGGYGSSGK